MTNPDDTQVTAIVEPQSIRPAHRFRQFIAAMAESGSAERGDEIMDSQIDKILVAESEDEIWNADAGGTVQARDVPGLEIQIHSLTFVRSTRDDIRTRSGVYGSMSCTVLGGPAEILTRNGLALGDDFVLQTGAELILAKVRSFQARDMLPINGVVTAIPTATGNDVLKLRRLPQRVTAGAVS